MVLLDFGKKELRPNLEDKHPREVKDFRGEFDLYIQFAEWNVEVGGREVCNSNDDNHVGGPMLRGLERFTGRTVSSFRLEFPSLSLKVLLGDDLALRLFCHQLERSSRHNYTFSTPQYHYTVNHQMEIKIAERV